jgi:DNA transposition AAA+ family ATPase
VIPQNDPSLPEYYLANRRHEQDQLAREGMQAIEQDARIDRSARMPATLTDEQRQTEIQRFRDFLGHAQGVSQKGLATMAGLSGSVMSDLLRGKYAGDVDAAIAKVDAAIENYCQREDTAAGGYVQTTVAGRIHAVMRLAAKHATMAAMYCPSGSGKTMALQAAMQLDFRNGLLVEIDPDNSSPYRFARALLAEILRPRSVPETVRSKGDAFTLIVKHLRHSRRLIAIDEAEALSLESFNYIRRVHDKTGCPVVFVGRPNLAMKLNQTTRCAEIGGSVRGRIMIELDLMVGYDGRGDSWLFTVEDVAKILRQYKVRFAADVARWLAVLANVSVCDGGREQGGLKYADYVFQVAITVAKNRGSSAVLLKHVKAANGACRDRDYAAQIAARVDDLMAPRSGANSAAATG